MSRKSKMARAGKAAHNAWKDQQRKATAQQEALEKAKTDRLLLSEFLPPVFTQGLGEDQDMTTIEEVSYSSFTRSPYQYSGSRLSCALWPYRLGYDNLKQIQRFWQIKLAEEEAKSRELERAQLADELFKTQISIERIKTSINYLTALIDMERPGMPVLPTYRQSTHFQSKYSVDVKIFIPASGEFNSWYHCHFVDGHVASATHDTVEVVYHGCVKANPSTKDLQICIGVYPINSVYVVKNKEYWTLVSDSFLSGEWLHLANIAGGNDGLSKDMYEALRKEQLRLQVGDYDYVAAVRKNHKS